MGNMPTKSQGDAATRSGARIPTMPFKGDRPVHKNLDPLSLQLHLDDVKQRVNMTPPEREWRKKWVRAQHLHPDEPIRVDAVYRQLNPIRRLYRYPWDRLYEVVLEPKFGMYKASVIRVMVPKIILGYVVASIFWYQLKYEAVDWERRLGMYYVTPKERLFRDQEIEAEHPGLIEQARDAPKSIKDYSDMNFKKRVGEVNIGPSLRPW